MKKLLILLTFILFCQLCFPQEQKYALKGNKPTSEGIRAYVRDNQYQLTDTFQKRLKDTLFLDVYMSADDLSTYSEYDSLELARTEIGKGGSTEIIIGTLEKYRDYSIDARTPRGKIKHFNSGDVFVRSVIYHEMMHLYFRQQEIILNQEDSLNSYYQNIQLVPNYEMRCGAAFIEEGICEYFIRRYGEIVGYGYQYQNQNQSQNQYAPLTIEDILNKKNLYGVRYLWSSTVLKDYLDSSELQNGNWKLAIQKLLRNKPPSYQEILCPELYFKRLK